jgi:hypothetical protein
MAKVQKERASDQRPAAASVEERIFDFAEDLGRFYGHAETRAMAWMDQRKTVLAQLTTLRDKASRLISTISGSDQSAVPAARRGRPPGGRKAAAGSRRGSGRARQSAADASEPAAGPGRRKGTKMSKAARAKIAAAQRARWARVRAAKG